LEQLGRGGFGTVWKARDLELDRVVAIKVPRHLQLPDLNAKQLFREARAVAQLIHPHIVRVHEIGREEDTYYIVSEFIDGVPLSDYAGHQALSAGEAAALCATIARAIHCAHQQGVIHRDLKPNNVLIDRKGEPHITDFGLAKRDATEVTVTADGQIFGTPAYMSPEQARGESHLADQRTDVYALGVILFQLLTGELPFRGNTGMLLHQILHAEPPSPRMLEEQTPRDLETICLKCMDKNPQRRYPSAADLADDLERWARDEPIRARPVGLFEKQLRWCRRHPWSATVAAAVVLTLLMLGVGIVAVDRARDQRLRLADSHLNDFSRVQQMSQRVEQTADSPALPEMLARRDLQALDALCQQLFTSEKRAGDSSVPQSHFASWFVLDAQGVMLAIAPLKRNVVGRDYSGRDYFQGAKRRRKELGVSSVHISQVFVSENDGLHKFAISAPVRDPQGTLLGVVCASLATDSSTSIELSQALVTDVFRWGLLSATPLILLALAWVISPPVKRILIRSK
jgi:serine/threonine-protein kinase